MTNQKENADTEIVDLSAFTTAGLDRGKPRWFETFWWVAKLTVIQTKFPWPSTVRKAVLQLFGATIGSGFYIRPNVNIHFPWKLKIGDNVWIGEGSTILNLEPVEIASNAALAHEVYIAAAGHDISSPSFEYKNRSVLIESGAWLATRCFVGPGVTVGQSAVVAAGAIVVQDVAPRAIVGGVPAVRIGTRELRKRK